MLQEHDDRLRIIRARTILDMLGERPATGRNLFRPLKGLDNAALLVRGGRVLDVLPWKSVRVPAGTPVADMGRRPHRPAGLGHPLFCLLAVEGRLSAHRHDA